MDHHRQNHHPRHPHNHQPRQQHHHHHHQPRHQHHHHHQPHPHIMNSPPSPPPPPSSRYLPLHPPPPQPPPPQPPSFPENHPNPFQHHPPNLSPPFHPNDFAYPHSPPHPHLHHRDHDHHRDLIYRSPPPRVHPPPPPPHPQPNRLHHFDDNPNFSDDLVLDRPRFRLNELPPPPPPPPPPHQHPRVSPVARRSPNQFPQFDRFGRQFDDPPPQPQPHPHPHPRFREDLNLQPYDSIDYQLHRDRVEDERRNMGVADRFEADFDRDWDRSRARERDHNERYYPELPLRNEFELDSGNNEYVDDEGLVRAGRRDNSGGYEENVSKRYGSREVSRSPIKFRIGGVEADDRFSNRGGRKEDVHEYNSVDNNNRGHPRKILQKKSAFLRIQEPGKPQQHHLARNGTSIFRNRFENSASPHKGKESSSEFVDTARIGEDRVGSPVELDVSFKSNALVAKPIMATPPSSSGVDVRVSSAVSDSGTAVVSESLAKVESRAKVESVKGKTVTVSKRVVKDSKSGTKVSPILKRVGKPNSVEGQRGSESSPGGSSSLSEGVTRKAVPKGKVLGKVDNKAGIDKVSSPTLKKKRKATTLVSRLSNTSTKMGSAVVNVASSATHPSDGSTLSDVSEKQLAKELSCRDIVIGLTQNVYVDTGKVGNIESPTVLGQEKIVGELGSEAPAPTVIGQMDRLGELDSEAPAPKRVRKEAILEPLPDLSVSLGAGVSEEHGESKEYSQDEQRISNPDEDVSKSLGKCSLDINSINDSVKDQDVTVALVGNCSVERSSELARVHMVDNLDNNDVCSGNVDTLDLVAVMNFISNPLKTEVDLLFPKVDADEPSGTQVLSSPEDAAIGLSLGGLYSDRNNEPGLSDSVDSPKLGRFSNDANKHSETQAYSSPKIATIGLSLGGLYADRKFESDLGDSEDNAKLGSLSNDVSADKRTPLDCDENVSIGLTNLNTVLDLRVTNDVHEQQYSGSEISGHDDTTVVREEAPKKCIYEADTLPFSVKEDSTVLKRKRKVGIEPDSFDSRMLESSHESLLSLSIPIENAMLPVEKFSSAASGPPCVKTDVSKEINYIESYVKGMNSFNHNGDLDQTEYTSSCGKKRKNLSSSSVSSDAQGSESSDLPAASLTLFPVADGPSASANNFPQSTEGSELHKSAFTAESVNGGASSSFGAATCSFDDNSKSDFVCKDSRLPVTESAPPGAEQSYLCESGCNQKIGETMTKAKADDENGLSLATYDGNIDAHLVSADHTEDVDQGPLVTNVESDDNGMIADVDNSDLLCSSADHTVDVDQGPLAVNKECDDNEMTTDVVNSGLLCSSADHNVDVDQGPLAVNKECDDNEMTTNDGNSGVLCLSADDTGDEDQRSLVVDMDCDDDIAPNAKLSSLPGCPHSSVESGFVGVTNHSDMFDTSNVVLPGDCSHSSPTLDVSNATPAFHVISGEKLSMDNDVSKQSSSTQSSFSSQASVQPESHKNNPKLGISTSLAVQPFTQKCALLPSKNVETTRTSSNSFTKPRRNVLTRSEATPSTIQRSPVIKSSNKTHTYPAKPRTWHRTNNSATPNIPVKKPPVRTLPPQRPSYGKAMKIQDTSYIRKGNSLVRNPTSGASIPGSPALGASADSSKPNDSSRIRKLVGFATESTELPAGSVTGGQSTPIEMPKTPPLSCSKTPDIDVVFSGEFTSSVHIDQSEEADNEEATNSSEINSLRDTENDGNKNLEDPGIFSDGDLLGLGSKKMVYIKRKSNQLIAASKSSQLSVQNMGRTAASCSDNYYKRRKNQLIRASSDGNIQQMVEVVHNNSRSLSQRASYVYTNRSSTKRPSNKGKSPKFSLVWKLGDSKATGKGVDALRSKRLLSLLLPWKRATYWSRKQLSSRKRGAVYVRSGRGFSLRRSKVISLPGTSLKWSKSMEKRSKKVEEEAAQAVDVQNTGSSGVYSKAVSSTHSVHKVAHSLKLNPGERIFRIGASRYRMDSSRKTLQRISDEEASEVAASKTGEDARKTYVPKRLLIGSDEYVRIGNGNQLVRDPKRRTRILASEKVRWSLHTARMRLAKKRKFCQFFTRFGKCNKGEGCPFIHDQSKVAVCTKFLNGLCVDSNCKLTHKVIPERMPDCLFYLQGLCSNEKCPYRHVNVNPKASICENFLRGYCAEGDECRKKHSYICPESEACGSCPQGSKCKLYHPIRVKSKKRKVSRDQNNMKGRYFGDRSVVVEPETRPLVEKQIEPSKGPSDGHGDLGDFISLDFDDVETSENGLTSEQAFLPEDDDILNSELDDLDELIKPLSIMGKL